MPRYIALRRNEVKDRVPGADTLNKWMEGRKTPEPLWADGSKDEPDMEAFPCLGLALRAARTGGTMPAVMNAANDVAVEAFSNERISFIEIPAVIELVMRRHRTEKHPSINVIREADIWARREAACIITQEK